MLKKTRNLFALHLAEQSHVQLLQQELKFKGLKECDTSLDPQTLMNNIADTFQQNKSVLCIGPIPQEVQKHFPEDAIIHVLVQTESQEIAPTQDVIHLPRGDIDKQFQEIANRHNLDIGDHVSNSSGLSGAPTAADCNYCRYLRDPTIEIPKTVYRSDNFFAMTTLGQLITPYLLIIPNEHEMSIAKFDLDRRKEFWEVLEDIRIILRLQSHSSHILAWENGTGNGGKGKAKDSVVHAHVHVAASSLTASRIQEISGFPMEDTTIETLSEHGKSSYLLLFGETPDDLKIAESHTLYIPRQYIRQLIADEYAIPGEQWNWRKYPFHEQRLVATDQMAQALIENRSVLPKRILKRTEEFLSAY